MVRVATLSEFQGHNIRNRKAQSMSFSAEDNDEAFISSSSLCMNYSALRKRLNRPSDPGKMIKSCNHLSVLLLTSCQCLEL